MASLAERSNNKLYEKIKKRKKQIKIIGLIGIILIFVAVIVLFISSQVNRNYNDYKILNKIKRADSNTVKYETYSGKILKYSRDGASALNRKGEVIWNGSYEFKSPAAAICENYVAIADIGGKEVYIYNGNDSGTKIEVLLPIVEVAVANQGVIAVLLEDTASNVIQIYDPYNTSESLRAEIPTNVETDGLPIDIAFSNDGQKIVTSYINVSNGAIESSVNFYNFDKVGQNSVDRLVGSRPFDRTVVPKIQFLNNNTICAYGENSITLYSMKQIPEDTFSQTFEEKIRSVFSSEKNVGVILENNNKDGKYKILVFDLAGKKVLEKLIDYDYETITISGEDIIFFSDTKCNIMRLNGSEKLNLEFEKNIEYFLPIKNTDRYFIIDDTNINEARLTGR